MNTVLIKYLRALVDKFTLTQTGPKITKGFGSQQAKSVPFCPQIGTFEKGGTVRNKIGTAHDRCCDLAKYCMCYACSQINAIPTGIKSCSSQMNTYVIIFSRYNPKFSRVTNCSINFQNRHLYLTRASTNSNVDSYR